MLPGTHNSLGRSAIIEKRVLIDGRRATEEGSGGGTGGSFLPPLSAAGARAAAAAATIDARGNVPALRFRRPAAVVGLVLDATGFREAVRADSLHVAGNSGSGPSSPAAAARALLAGCSVASSGDDAVVAAGRFAALTLLDCAISGACRAGVRAFAGGDVELRGCSVGRCGTHGLAAQALSPSSPLLASSSPSPRLGGRISAKRCRISDCREEGALCSGQGSRLVLEGVEIVSCSGPAVDASGSGCSVLLRGETKISGCAGGGLWLWQGARGKVSGKGNSISCEETFAVLTEGQGTRLEIEEGGCCCEVSGGVKGAEAERAVAAAAAKNGACDSSDRDSGNGKSVAARQQRQQLQRHCGPPPEAGPFRWDGPDPLRAE